MPSVPAAGPSSAPSVPPALAGPSGALPLSRLLETTADAVAAVQRGQSLTEALARCPADARAGTQALSFHVMRWLGSAGAVREALAARTPPPPVESLLLTALALLWPTDAPPPYAAHTLVDQAVQAARRRAPAAAGFVNAVLRRFVREQDAQVAAARQSPAGAWNHPVWWIERLRQDWPAHWTTLLAQANLHPPMTLRVNARRGDAADWAARASAAGHPARVLDDPPGAGFGGHAVVLDAPCAVQSLPGFADGQVSVQDAAAQRAAPLLLRGADGARPLPPGARVLDACAAPGGKTAHLLELADLELLALDSDAQRLQRVQQTLERLRLGGAGPGGGGPRATLRAADARRPVDWWDGRPFDAILLDAPCTASGIVRRHPDVRWLRRPGDVAALAQVQAGLLEALWPLLAPGGRLLYATCSLFRAEGQAQVDAFLQRHGDRGARPDAAAPGHLLPLPDNPPRPGHPAGPALQDGFFYALLHKD